jgi:ubiquinone biosynthesis monooxygenase Coq7
VKQSTIARILRVNHGGEHGAIRIYRTQIAIAQLRCPDLLPFLSETLGHEEEHLTRFRNLMPARQAKPCRLMWLWAVGGSVLGAITALLGRRSVLMCTEAVERTVHAHLDEQLRYIGETDAELASTIRQIQEQELGHLQFAVAGRGEATLISAALDRTITVVTEALIWISTRGDSAALHRELSSA